MRPAQLGKSFRAFGCIIAARLVAIDARSQDESQPFRLFSRISRADNATRIRLRPLGRICFTASYWRAPIRICSCPFGRNWGSSQRMLEILR